MVTLGFNLIVKNEENCLEKTLQNIRGIADEIVVTDTGSSDATPEIAKKYADRVLFHEWQDSFSEARNWSLSYSEADWICWIDADEWIENPDMVKPYLTQHSDAMTFLCPINNEMPTGVVARHFLPKIFRNRTAHFEGIVHNQLIHQPPIYPTQITFWHSGYNESPEIMKKKQERTIRLLRKQLDTDPENTFAIMKLARSLWNHGCIDACREMIKRGLEIETESTPIRQLLLYQKVLSELYEMDSSIFCTLNEGLSINPHNIDLLFLKAEALLQYKNYVDVIITLHAYRQEKALQAAGHYNDLILDYWDTGVREHEMLATAYLNLEQYADARAALKQVLTFKRYDAGHWGNYLHCLKQLGDIQAVIAAQNEMMLRGILCHSC